MKVTDRYFTDEYRPGLEAFYSAAFDDLGMSASKDQAVDLWLETIQQQCSANFLRLTINADTRHLFRGVNVPTLAIANEKDILVPVSLVHYGANLIAGAQFAIIMSASHGGPGTAADTRIEMMTTFIRTGTLPKTAGLRTTLG